MLEEHTFGSMQLMMKYGQIGESLFFLDNLLGLQLWLNKLLNNFVKTVLIPRLERLNGSLIPHYCARSESIISNECPSSEWQSLAAFQMITNNSVPPVGLNMYHEQVLPYSTQLTGRNSLRQFVLSSDLDYRPGANRQTFYSTTQHSVIADALTSTGALWDFGLVNTTSGSTHGSPFSDLRAATHATKHNYYQPYTLGTCSGAMFLNMTEGSPIAFPISSGRDELGTGNTTIPSDDHHGPYCNGTEYYGISPAQILEIPRSSHLDFGLKWVDLPENLFNGSSIGAIVLFPRETANSSQLFYTCTISAGWGSSSLSTSTSYAVQPVLSQADLPSIVQQLYAQEIAKTQDKSGVSNRSKFQSSQVGTIGIFEEPHYPEKPIRITSDWADYLNPYVPNINTTAFNALMSLDKVLHMANHSRATFMLVGLVTNGLARVGFQQTLQGSLKTFRNPKTNDTLLDGNYWTSGKGDVFLVDPIESKDWVRLLVESGLQSYAYNTTGTAPKIAIAFLLTYCLFALSHVLYASFSGTVYAPRSPALRGLELLFLDITNSFAGISSTSWDSIAEVTALAMNSTPTVALRNTCAGITKFHIFKLPVRILTMKDDEGDGEHLELVFGTVEEDEVKERTIKANRMYGTMPSLRRRTRAT